MRRALLVMCAALAAAASCAAEPMPSKLTYSSPEADLPVSFEYLTYWRLTEERGTVEPYRAVRLQGLRNADGTYTAYMVVRAFPVQPPGSPYADQRAFVARLLTNLPDGASMDPQTTRSVAGVGADDFTVTYTIPPLHHAGRKAVKIPVKTRTVVLEHGPFLYELAYSADERSYGTHLADFEDLLSSLQFR